MKLIAPMEAGSGKTDAEGRGKIEFPRKFPGVPRVFLSSRDPEARGVTFDLIEVNERGFEVRAWKTRGIVHKHRVHLHRIPSAWTPKILERIPLRVLIREEPTGSEPVEVEFDWFAVYLG